MGFKDDHLLFAGYLPDDIVKINENLSLDG
jgi:hypothetical protein